VQFKWWFGLLCFSYEIILDFCCGLGWFFELFWGWFELFTKDFGFGEYDNPDCEVKVEVGKKAEYIGNSVSMASAKPT